MSPHRWTAVCVSRSIHGAVTAPTFHTPPRFAVPTSPTSVLAVTGDAGGDDRCPATEPRDRHHHYTPGHFTPVMWLGAVDVADGTVRWVSPSGPPSSLLQRSGAAGAVVLRHGVHPGNWTASSAFIMGGVVASGGGMDVPPTRDSCALLRVALGGAAPLVLTVHSEAACAGAAGSGYGPLPRHGASQ